MANDAPGPRGWPLIGVAPEFRRSPLALVMQATADYGDVVRLPLFKLPLTPLEPRNCLYLVNEPGLVRRVCLTHRQKYRTHRQLVDKLKLVLDLGEGELLTSVGQPWVERKAALQPVFSDCGAWADRVVQSVAEVAARWSRMPADARIDVDHEMTTLVTSLFANLFVGLDLNGADAAIAPAWSSMLNGYSRRMAAPFEFLLRLPTRANREFQAARQTVERRLARAIDDHLQCPHRFRDVLSAWLLAGDDHDAGLTQKSMRDQLVLLLLAGRKNVANALTWAFHLLGRNPESAAAVAAEVRDASACVAPGHDRWKRLRYVAAVQKEVLRLYPTAWLIARYCLEDDMLGEYRIPAGSTVFISPYVIHRRPDLWPEPERFDPARFLGESRSTPFDGYLPFGVGPRTCIGAALTELIMRVAIAMLTEKFEFSPVSDHQVEIKATSSLYPRRGLPMTIRQRRASEERQGYAMAGRTRPRHMEERNECN